jgi:hypothetical protein
LERYRRVAGQRLETHGLSDSTARSVPDGIGRSQPMQTFMVECYWPGTIEANARETLNRVVRSAGEGVPGEAVRFLGCILVPADGTALFLVPADGTALFLFAASSEDVVRGVGRLADVPFDRIVESVVVGFGQPRPER